MSSSKHKEQRVAILMDVANMYHSARNLYGARVNFGKILEEASAGRQLIRAMAYVIKSTNPDEGAFLEALEKAGFEIHTKDLQVFSDGSKKGDWDVGIAVDALSLAGKVDTVVLVTGDGDFRPLCIALREKGCRVEVVGFEQSASQKLRDVADEFVDLSGDKKTFLLPIRAALRPRRPRFLGGNSGNRQSERPESAEPTPVIHADRDSEE